MPSEQRDRFCAVCGERIGVDEPIVVLSHGVVLWRTSLARDKPGPDDVVMHAACAPVPPEQEEHD